MYFIFNTLLFLALEFAIFAGVGLSLILYGYITDTIPLKILFLIFLGTIVSVYICIHLIYKIVEYRNWRVSIKMNYDYADIFFLAFCEIVSVGFFGFSLLFYGLVPTCHRDIDVSDIFIGTIYLCLGGVFVYARYLYLNQVIALRKPQDQNKILP